MSRGVPALMTTPQAFSTGILHLPARVVVPTDYLRSASAPHGFVELSGVGERPMIIRMARLQQRYDHRLRDLIGATGDVTIAMDLGVPHSTARGWLAKAPKVVVSLDVTDLRASELQQEVLELRRRVKKLSALVVRQYSDRPRIASQTCRPQTKRKRPASR
jgi:hypothetical protein